MCDGSKHNWDNQRLSVMKALLIGLSRIFPNNDLYYQEYTWRLLMLWMSGGIHRETPKELKKGYCMLNIWNANVRISFSKEICLCNFCKLVSNILWSEMGLGFELLTCKILTSKFLVERIYLYLYYIFMYSLTLTKICLVLFLDLKELCGSGRDPNSWICCYVNNFVNTGRN